jgi:hypothetical protein
MSDAAEEIADKVVEMVVGLFGPSVAEAVQRMTKNIGFGRGGSQRRAKGVFYR